MYTSLYDLLIVLAKCYEMAGELGDLQQWIILFLFLFHLLCNSIKYTEYYDSKGVCEIIQVDKY